MDPANPPTDLTDPDLDENAETVLRKRYLKQDETGNPAEEPKDLFWRVAVTIAAEERKYHNRTIDPDDLARRFYHMMAQGIWEPNSPTLFNAGRRLGQLSACFVLPVEDDLVDGPASIAGTLRNMMAIHQSGGGTGFSFSRLRRKGARVASTSGVASGPVSFLRLYDAATNTVKQGGNRRGANMGILRVDHPDILKFIRSKEDRDELVNFNISVAATDEFMRRAREGEEYDLRDPHTGEVVDSLNASKVLDEIIEHAHDSGEPGLFFVDEANRFNPVPHMGDYEATNPCGEQPLLPYDVCNLGSLNLSKFVTGDFNSMDDLHRSIDFEGMREYIHLSMRFLDNVIDANEYPLPEIRDVSDRIRRVGNGVMGWADMLAKLGVAYDTEAARDIADEVAEFFHRECLNASEELAAERGVFPEWEHSIWGPDSTCARDEHGNRIRPKRRLRNSNTNTVAPTGTISIIAGCSGGIEPLYALTFTRQQAGEEMIEVNDEFRQVLEWNRADEAGAILRRVEEKGTADVEGVPPWIADIFKTAHEIDPEDHVRMQAVWQKHTDAAISKTINFRPEASVDDVRRAYELAYELDCKGITVYRDQSREGQALSTGSQASEPAPESTQKKTRPQTLRGVTKQVRTPLGDAYVTINKAQDGPFETFVNVGKAGGSVTADAEAMGRLISLALRSGVPMQDIVDELVGISSDRAVGFGSDVVRSLPDAIGQMLAEYLQEQNGTTVQTEVVEETIAACPDCDSEMQFQEGCLKCAHCGYSECG